MKQFTRLNYLWYRLVRNGWRLAAFKLTKRRVVIKRYAGKPVSNAEEGYRQLYDLIMAGRPFMAARYGTSELSGMLQAIAVQTGLRRTMRRKKVMELYNNAGFFPPTQAAVSRFGQLMVDASAAMDLLGVWYNPMEDYIVRTCAPQAQFTHLDAIDPHRFTPPWTRALRGKRVLVIHPFEETIKSQYARRGLLFADPEVLPDFQLLTLRAVQTVGDNTAGFPDWFAALDYMTTQALAMDFDIALIGCGAYGFPLAARIKRAGKMAIHMGGVLQILFGIKGKRWDERPDSAGLYNEHWVRPAASETPQAAATVEGACYW
jgi:hypothetical protein